MPVRAAKCAIGTGAVNGIPMKGQPMSLKNLALLLISLLLSACTHTPPDILGCTPYPAADWPQMREGFLKLCGDDPVCAVNLPKWRETISHWTYPSDAGTCVTWMTQKVFDLDATHKLPGGYTDSGKDEEYKDLMVGGVYLPAKESVAPMKTFVQSFCHDSKECGAAGNWQGTVDAIDMNLKTQAAKVSSLESKPVAPKKKTN